MNKYLIKLANHLDKKGLHKEADYVDWIIKNADEAKQITFSDEKAMCVALLGQLYMKASKKDIDGFVKKRDDIIKLKENGSKEIKNTLKDFTKNLAGAYYYGGLHKNDEDFQAKVKKKFGMSKEEAKLKLDEIENNCKK